MWLAAAFCTVATCCGWGGIPVYHPLTFVAAMAGWAVALVSWMLSADRQWQLRSHRLLLFAVPLMGFLVVFSAVPYRAWSLPVLGACLVLLSIRALKGSPLLSAIVLIIAVCFPAVLLGSLIAGVGYWTRAQGFGWTQLDKPTASGWRPLLATEALQIGAWLVASSLATGLVIGWFARRAAVRLRRVRRERVGWRKWLRDSW